MTEKVHFGLPNSSAKLAATYIQVYRVVAVERYDVPIFTQLGYVPNLCGIIPFPDPEMEHPTKHLCAKRDINYVGSIC